VQGVLVSKGDRQRTSEQKRGSNKPVSGNLNEVALFLPNQMNEKGGALHRAEKGATTNRKNADRKAGVKPEGGCCAIFHGGGRINHLIMKEREREKKGLKNFPTSQRNGISCSACSRARGEMSFTTI